MQILKPRINQPDDSENQIPLLATALLIWCLDQFDSARDFSWNVYGPGQFWWEGRLLAIGPTLKSVVTNCLELLYRLDFPSQSLSNELRVEFTEVGGVA